MPALYEALGMELPDFVQGKSLLPQLTERNSTDVHRSYVRAEYHNSLHPHCVRPQYSDTQEWIFNCHANMIFDGRFKMIVYHGHNIGELYDLQEDPNEFTNLWDDPDTASIKMALMKTNFDAEMLATDEGQPRVGLF